MSRMYLEYSTGEIFSVIIVKIHSKLHLHLSSNKIHLRTCAYIRFKPRHAPGSALTGGMGSWGPGTGIKFGV